MNLIRTACVVVAITCVSACGKSEHGPLPATWTKEFSIYASAGGGMPNESIEVRVSYDSCVYVKKENNTIFKKAIPLSDVSRTTILKELRTLHMDRLPALSAGPHAVIDQETTSICFENKKQYCIWHGDSGQVKPEDFADFTRAYQFLTDIVQPEKK